MRDRVVVAVPLHLMLEGSIERIVDACSEAQRLHNTADHARDPLDIRRHALQTQTQLELVAAGLDGIGGAWGYDPCEASPPPRYCPPPPPFPRGAYPHIHATRPRCTPWLLGLTASEEPGKQPGDMTSAVSSSSQGLPPLPPPPPPPRASLPCGWPRYSCRHGRSSRVYVLTESVVPRI